MTVSAIESSDRICEIVSQFIQGADLAPDRYLGLTSMHMVNLMLTIEAEFDLTIPRSKLVPSNFRTIDSIEKLLRDLAH